jgi:hypothetical protein
MILIFHAVMADPTTMPLKPKPTVEFMSFKDGKAYAKDYEFTDPLLITIQPDNLVRWMCLNVYGVADPAPNDNPTKGRSSLLEHYTKCISYTTCPIALWGGTLSIRLVIQQCQFQLMT